MFAHAPHLRHSSPRRPGAAGLSLVEVLVAAAILVIIVGPMAGMFITSRRSAEGSVHRTEAVALARSTMDQAAAQTWEDLVSTGPHPHPLNDAYTVQVQVTDRKDCSYLKDIRVRVSWTEGRERRWIDLHSSKSLRKTASP